MDFTSFEQKTIEALNDCKSAVKHCSKNSISHLEKAWKIKDIDTEMAIFRGITAEEEAASALFHSLKNNQYKNSSKLQFKQHTYKLGLYPFLQGIGTFLHDSMEITPFDKFNLHHTEQSGRKAIELMLSIKDSKMNVYPKPPLHFTISKADSNEVFTFESNFEELIKGKNYSDALKYIKDIANERNRLLYASTLGRPKVTGDIEGFLNNQKKKVIVILTILLMVDPWEKIQGSSHFVQQALDSFLLLLKRINTEDVFQPYNEN